MNLHEEEYSRYINSTVISILYSHITSSSSFSFPPTFFSLTRPISPGGKGGGGLNCKIETYDVKSKSLSLESAMIANPSLKAYRYDPYSKEFTQEYYEHEQMKQNRKNAIQTAKVGHKNISFKNLKSLC